MRSIQQMAVLATLTSAVALPLLAGPSTVTSVPPAETVASFIEAARWGDVETIDLAIADGMDVDARGEDGATAIRWAAVEGQTAVVRRLIDAGADVDSADGDGTTGLMVAARWGHLGVVELLIEAGARVDTRSTLGAGRTALMYAAIKGDGRILDLLLAAGADPTISDGHGNTPADLARRRGHAEVAATLATAARAWPS